MHADSAKDVAAKASNAPALQQPYALDDNAYFCLLCCSDGSDAAVLQVKSNVKEFQEHWEDLITPESRYEDLRSKGLIPTDTWSILMRSRQSRR